MRQPSEIENADDIDFENSILGNSLKQIKRVNKSFGADEKPPMITVWVCDIDPRSTKDMLNIIEDYTDSEMWNLKHLKRFKKIEAESCTRLATVVCSCESLHDENILIERLKLICGGRVSNLNLRKVEVPAELPNTKELSMHWGSLYWPLNWKGNPSHQTLLNANFNLVEESRIIQMLFDFENSSMSSCIIVKADEKSNALSVVSSCHDDRDRHPLRHATMVAVEEIAAIEKSRRTGLISKAPSNYLCNDLIVYTTHEPCAMCAMALVHSRIKRLCYVFPHPKGAIESTHFIGDRRDLNWTFEIWRWVGSPRLKFELSRNLAP